MNKFLPILVGTTLLIGGGAYYATQTGGAVPGVSMAEAQEAAADIELAPDYALGAEDAPVTIYEYASFTCPHCANFHETVFSDLKEDYIDTGKVRFIQREVYFDRYGLWAGMIARCGGEMRYYGISDLIYTGQSEWIGSGDANEILDNLKQIGRLAGMDDETMDACLQDEGLAQSMVAAYQKHATEDEINATPSFVINGTKYSNMSYEDLSAIIDAELEG